MLKKRIIFTLLFEDDQFVLSRNFRLQRIGSLAWLEKNYDFSRVSSFIDELVVLDVSRGKRDLERFCDALKALSRGCFVPIAAGGGIRSIEDARTLLRSGADKVVVNHILFFQPALLVMLAAEFGQQCVVGSVDLSRVGNILAVLTNNGARAILGDAIGVLQNIDYQLLGEVYLNSIDRDGTGQGYDFTTLDAVPPNAGVPIILAGGVGNAAHLNEGLAHRRVDAVATAHLLNFMGDGLENARRSIIQAGHPVATWPDRDILTRSIQ